MVEIVDVSLRDGQQSLLATRLRTSDLLPVVQFLDDAGFWSLEVWGGATFDVALRYLGEDPWERLRSIKRLAKKTPLQMLLRGQNLVGYKQYPDDICKKFVEKSVENGIDVIRIFDALNDFRNLETVSKAANSVGAHVQVALVYSTSPVHTVDYYSKLAEEVLGLGAQSICLKDMSGILHPSLVGELIKTMKRRLKLPIDLHSHSTAGLAPLTYLKAAEAGVDILDCAVSSMSLATSLPPVETIVAALSNGGPPKIDLSRVLEATKYLLEVRKRFREFDYAVQSASVDVDVLMHQIPGGMYSNLLTQLKEQNSLGRLSDVLSEVPRVRADLGYPPLVTPLSQIVGTQAVMNVLSGGRYKVVLRETRDYIRGLYGRPPSPVSRELSRSVLGGEEPLSRRPADMLESMMPRVMKELPKEYVGKEEDYLSYALFPEATLKLLKGSKEAAPPLKSISVRVGDSMFDVEFSKR